MEQLAARRAHNPEVEGSSPSPATNSSTCHQLVKCIFLLKKRKIMSEVEIIKIYDIIRKNIKKREQKNDEKI